VINGIGERPGDADLANAAHADGIEVDVVFLDEGHIECGRCRRAVLAFTNRPTVYVATMRGTRIPPSAGSTRTSVNTAPNELKVTAMGEISFQ